EIERQILNAAFAEFDVRTADAFGHDRCVAPRDLQHFVRHIDANYFSFRTHNLRGNEANFSGSTADIENYFAFVQITRRIAASIIELDHFARNDFEILGLIIDRTTKFLRSFLRSGRVALTNNSFPTSRFDHSDASFSRSIYSRKANGLPSFSFTQRLAGDLCHPDCYNYRGDETDV